MKAVFSVFVLSLLVALSLQQNPPACENLNGIWEQKVGGHYQQHLQDFQIVNDDTVVAIQNFRDVHPKDFYPSVEGTSLRRIVVPNSKDNKILLEEVTLDYDEEHTKDTPIVPGFSKTKIHVMSNIFNATYSEKRVEQRFALALLTPRQNSALSTIKFAVAEPNAANLGSFKEEHLFDFVYPWEAGTEKVYNANGSVVRDQLVNLDSVSVHNNAKTFGPGAEVSLAAFWPAAEGTAEVVALITTQGSTKLVKYKLGLSFGDLKVTKTESQATLVVPTVDSSNSSSFIVGGRVMVQGSTILVLTHLHKQQAAAFQEVTKQNPNFKEGQEIAPILLKYKSDLTLISVENLASALPETTATVLAYGFDTRGSNAVVVGNTRDIMAQRSEADNQRPWFVNVAYNNETFQPNSRVAGFLTSIIEKKDAKDTRDIRFWALSVAFSLDADTTKFMVGGEFGEYQKEYEFDGMLALVSAPTGNTPKILYRLEVGESGSNAVILLRRFKRVFWQDRDAEILITGNFMDGPQTRPPKRPVNDPYRSVKVGFWQVNCAPKNAAMEAGVTYSFYVFFALNTLVFALVVGFYTLKAIHLRFFSRGTYNRIQ